MNGYKKSIERYNLNEVCKAMYHSLLPTMQGEITGASQELEKMTLEEGQRRKSNV